MMKRFFLHAGRVMILCVLAAFTFTACEDDDEPSDDFGNGSPQAANVVVRPGYEYEYNEQGLVTQVTRVTYENDGQGNQVEKREVQASISYPQSNRAVLEQYESDGTFTYVFAFGSDNFAHQIIEKDPEGGSYLYKLDYDSEGHLIYLKDSEDVLKMRWENGNLVYIEQDEYNASVELTYGSGTNFLAHKLSPFLLDVDMGPFMNDMNWWFEVGLDHALYAGFLGKPLKNLPATLTSHDDENSEPSEYEFEYYDGGYSLKEVR